MIEKTLKLDMCVICPYYSYDARYMDDCFCHLSHKKIRHEIGSKYPIPEWCKLSNAPVKTVDSNAVTSEAGSAEDPASVCSNGGARDCQSGLVREARPASNLSQPNSLTPECKTCRFVECPSIEVEETPDGRCENHNPA